MWLYIHFVSGLGFHVAKKLIFIVDAEGDLFELHINKDSTTKRNILKQENLDFFPLDVTVDWLNNYLYIVGEMKYQIIPRYIIKRCDLNCTSLTVAYADLPKKPTGMQIDPING